MVLFRWVCLNFSQLPHTANTGRLSLELGLFQAQVQGKDIKFEATTWWSDNIGFGLCWLFQRVQYRCLGVCVKDSSHIRYTGCSFQWLPSLLSQSIGAISAWFAKLCFTPSACSQKNNTVELSGCNRMWCKKRRELMRFSVLNSPFSRKHWVLSNLTSSIQLLSKLACLQCTWRYNKAYDMCHS